jgi:hypothetical protein
VWGMPRDLRMDILKTFADHRFLLAESQLNYVLDRYVPRAMVAALDSLPRNLTDVYHAIMDRIDAKGPLIRDLALRTLSWIFHAGRPLYMNELRELLVVQPGDKEVLRWTLPNDARFLEHCEGLVMYDVDAEIVRNIHYTVHNFLQTRDEINKSNPKLAEICLTYLAFDEFEQGPLLDDRALQKRMKRNKAAAYVSQFWSFHTRGEAERNPVVRASVLRVLSSENRKNAMLEMERYGRSDSVQSSFVSGQSPLHILARLGLSFICRHILEGIWDEVERYMPCHSRS